MIKILKNLSTVLKFFSYWFYKSAPSIMLSITVLDRTCLAIERSWSCNSAPLLGRTIDHTFLLTINHTLFCFLAWYNLTLPQWWLRPRQRQLILGGQTGATAHPRTPHHCRLRQLSAGAKASAPMPVQRRVRRAGIHRRNGWTRSAGQCWS
jgi:hypothetical protein